MKNAIKIILLTLVLALVACEKSQVKPQTANTNAAQTIQVEYKIHAATSAFTYEIIIADAQGKSVTEVGDCNKTDKSVAFSWTQFQNLKVKAKNLNPSHDEVSVEIYVNGQLMKSGLANQANKWAEAEYLAQ